MTTETQTMIRQHWQKIEKKVPGTRFNYDFWSDCQPRRSTWPACRAVIAAREQGSQLQDAMISLIQQAYYLHARNPSDDVVLLDLASSLALDVDRFRDELNAAKTQQVLRYEIQLSQKMEVADFPGLVLENNGSYQHVRIDYNDVDVMLQQITSGIKL